MSAHDLQRSVDRLSVGHIASLEARRAQLADDALAETEHQFQVTISGTATDTAAWTTVTIGFDVDFFDAPEQRDNPLDRPHFTYGSELNVDPGGPPALAVCASVTGWIRDDRDAYRGAEVAIAVWDPTASGEWDYDGLLHVSFQGWGALSEDGNVTMEGAG